MMRRLLVGDELTRQLVRLPHWACDGFSLTARFDFPTFLDLIGAVGDIALVAEELDHHPDLDIRWRTLRVALTTHSAGGLTQLDVESAHRVNECARGFGGTAQQPPPAPR